MEQAADYQAKEIELGDRKAKFKVYYQNQELGTMELTVPGRHNVYNALATLIVCLEAGLTFAQVADAMKQYSGAKRRFQVLGEVNGMMVIDDYAHHPTEIQATIAAAKATGKNIIAVFQPQRYSRTFFLLDQFSRSFHEADQVIITDIYAPSGEERIEGVDSESLVQLIRKKSNPNVRYIPTEAEVLAHLIEEINPGDLVLTMGAGDIYKVAHDLMRSFRKR